MNNGTWLIRREFWENRAIWMIPAVFGGFLLLVALFGQVSIPRLVSAEESHEAAAAFLVAVGAAFAVILGDDEVAANEATVKPLARDGAGQQRRVPLGDLTTMLVDALVGDDASMDDADELQPIDESASPAFVPAALKH